MTFRKITFPLAAAVPAVAAMLLPVASHVDARIAFARIGIVIAWWSSIVLASLPYVTGGAVLANACERLPRSARVLALAAMIAPTCDCASAGYAAAFTGLPPAFAGFALVWSAGAAPPALFATYGALGSHLLVARVAGVLAAAALTGMLWAVDGCRAIRDANASAPNAAVCHAHAPRRLCDRIATAVGALAISAGLATLALTLFGHLAASATPLAAALSGALLSPCSTSDAVIARALVHRPASQIAFVIASQAVDARQLATFARAFGARRTILAAIAGFAGCSVGMLCAR